MISRLRQYIIAKFINVISLILNFLTHFNAKIVVQIV